MLAATVNPYLVIPKIFVADLSWEQTELCNLEISRGGVLFTVSVVLHFLISLSLSHLPEKIFVSSQILVGIWNWGESGVKWK